MRLLRRLLIAAMAVAALLPSASAAANSGAPVIKSAWTAAFPEYVHSTSVAIGPDGAPTFGVSTEGKGPSLAHVTSTGELATEELATMPSRASTTTLRFDPQGNLWFAIAGGSGGGNRAVGRLAPDGALSEFKIPKGAPITALTIGPEGDVWLTRSGYYGKKARAQIDRLTPAGAATQFPLKTGSHPVSITPGPDGALWFTEEGSARIGRITSDGQVRLFPLGRKVEPHQIVAGADGSLWFSENAQAHRYGKISDRIGRITTAGTVTQFPVPFGGGTEALVADPRGVVWFATTEGDFSSVSPSGNIGPRGCVGFCEDPIESLAIAPDGSLWFAAGHATCLQCGGGSDLMIAAEGTTVGKIPAGAIEPADPDGPPSVDPYAGEQPKPPPPIARTGKAELVEGDFADLTGYIDSRGFPTTWLFKWGKTKHYDHKGFYPEFPFEAEEGAANIEEPIDGLCPRTTYHYEIVAYGPGGSTPGGDRTFRTPAEQDPPKGCRSH
jgi:virginiamycin B lyase